MNNFDRIQECKESVASKYGIDMSGNDGLNEDKVSWIIYFVGVCSMKGIVSFSEEEIVHRAIEIWEGYRNQIVPFIRELVIRIAEDNR